MANKPADISKNGEFITIKGARMHNLRNIDVHIPRNKLVVITGMSGSGKSSLAFDTLYAEGQRRYVESLSSYARQFLGKIDKPSVDDIDGISPAIAIEQKVSSRSSRSTVGTSTEIYDYLKLMYARIGRTISPISGKQVKRAEIEDVVEDIYRQEEGSKFMISFPVKLSDGQNWKDRLEIAKGQGYSRVLKGDEIRSIEDISPENGDTIYPILDRLVLKLEDDSNRSRIADSIELAMSEGFGDMRLTYIDGKGMKHVDFNHRFELDDMTFEVPSVNFFSFNNPYGACKRCEGFGSVIGVDPDLVIPNKNFSIFEDAIVCWKGEKMSRYKDELIENAHHFDFPIHRPYYELTQEQKDLLWTGNEYFKGLDAFFRFLESKTHKIQYRVMLSRYRGKAICPDCRGTRLRPDADFVKVDNKSIIDLVNMPITRLAEHFRNIKLSDFEIKVVQRIIVEINSRLECLLDVGLGYLTLNRLSSTLSGGETQRINLATSIGSSLVGSLYILDEPSIGLHTRDTRRLIKVLKNLRDLGNTVVVVEHDDEIMNAADYIIDLGPEAGSQGGQLVFEGSLKNLLKFDDSLTAGYLNGNLKIDIPSQRRKWDRAIKVVGASEHNLKNIDVEFPLRAFTSVTGVSGSGKTTLVSKILFPAVSKMLGGYGDKTGAHAAVTGDVDDIDRIEFIDQNPIGKSSRSNPVTYIKAYDDIRSLFAALPQAKMRGYKPSHFSFNVDGGRCDVCKGDGTVTIEMQFMSDIIMKCDHCNGKRFNEDVLELKHRDKDISDILEMTIDEAIDFFASGEASAEKRIADKLKPLQDVGLGYVHLGQPSNTLSGGEAQRIKLAFYLSKGHSSDAERIFFIFDEPTTGLHFHDIKKLLNSFEALIKLGHTIVTIEHNLDVVKCADWVIDLGPEGGDEGGGLLFAGTPENLIECKESYTGEALRDKFEVGETA